MKIKLKIEREYDVVTLHAKPEPRYWEDTSVNGVNDMEGELMPLRNGDVWDLKIDIATGKIQDWPQGTTADVHYKVCDAGTYDLLDADGDVVVSKDGYVPDFLCPKDSGHGDYIIMDILPDGTINNWKFRADYFTAQEY